MHCWLFKDIHFVWLETLTILVNNLINIFFNKSKHYFISCSFHSISTNISNIASINNIIINWKTFTLPFNPFFFFMLLIVKSFEILPKHSIYGFISESCFELIYFCGIKGAFSVLRQFSAAESPLKWWIIFFVSPQKLFSFSRYLSFCYDFLVT